MKLLNLLLFLALTGAVQAQQYITISKGCNFDGDENGSEYYSFDPSEEAARIVKQILDGAGGLSHGSIIVKESNVENAVATIVDKRRYILYSTTFLEKFKGDAKTKWAAYTVLAHEIGHHLNGHDFGEKDAKRRRQMELEADKFAGAICRTLGATLAEAIAGMESMKLAGETTTHPAKGARTAAIANGWKLQDDVLKRPGSGAGREMESAVESLSGKFYQRFGSIEVVLISAKSVLKTTTFSFLVKNIAQSEIDFYTYLGPKLGAVPCSIVNFEDYYLADDLILEGVSVLKDDTNMLRVKIAEQSSSVFKVIFKDLKSMEIVPELRVAISVGSGALKTLVFKNIPFPYEMRK